ncbi:MAG: N-acetylmuramoyl-L-alanine amidase [Cyanobacteria bacterium SID2]|nr:N-acetylmuramoyl-L-alanine amidase [Cyanobacteria bacterium SID2]
MKVTLEIGHGPYIDRNGFSGFEKGVEGNGTTEYDEVVVMAELIRRNLQNRGHAVEVLDPQETLFNIGQRATGDVFVSLHLNAFNGSVQGSEVLIHRNGTPEDFNLGTALQRSIVRNLGLNDRGVKRQGLAVLAGVPLTVKAACLTEPFFVDAVNSATARRYTEKAANALADGIIDYGLDSGLISSSSDSKPLPPPVFDRPFQLRNVAKYYKGLTHQRASLDWLQDRLDDSTVREFIRRWRNQ